MERTEIADMLKDRLVELIGADQLVDELFHAMTLDESIDNLEYIDRMFDTGIMEEVHDEMNN